jgi:membrane-bound metal-dependent hydrolase YbcI (DUF457 family)
MAYNRLGDRRALPVLPAFVLLAICPDFDYFAIWLFHANPAPRVTHSLLFGLASASLVWLCIGGLRQRHLAKAPFPGLLIASLSHPLLDLLVGAHPVPLLWPLNAPDVSLPFGLLPSAGRLALGNYYLWRNLMIELMVLLPVLSVLVALARRTPRRAIAVRALVIAPVWLVFVIWSVGLQR